MHAFYLSRSFLAPGCLCGARIVLVLILSFAGGPPVAHGDSGIVLSDSFDEAWKKAPAQYALFQDSGFSCGNGMLQGELSLRGSSWLFLLPSTGTQGAFGFSASFSDVADASFTIALTTQHNLIYGPLYLHVDLRTGQLRFTGGAEGGGGRAAYPFSPGKGYYFLLLRNKDSVLVRIDGQTVLSGTVHPQQAAQELEPPYRDAHTWALYMDSKGNDPNPTRNRSRLGDYRPNRVRFDDFELRGSYDGPAYRKTELGFAMGGKPYHFSLIHETGWERWAGEACGDAAEKMNLMHDQAFPVDADVPNVGAVVSRGIYYKGGGNNNRLGITFQWANKDNPGGLSVHELAHNWGALYSDYSAKEGVTYIAPIIDSEQYQGIFRTSADLDRRWNLAAWPDDKRQRFKDALLSGRSEFDYEKGAVFWYILYRALGYRVWLEAHREIAAAGRFLDYKAIRTILERVSRKDLGPLFRGWVESGQGLYNPLDLFIDSDGDGLNNLDEQVLGTNPAEADSDRDGYADLLEIAVGYSPLDAQDNPGRTLVPGGPAGQWSQPGVNELSDSKGDNTPYDLKAVSYFLDKANRELLFRIEWHEPVFGAEAFRGSQAYTQFYFGDKRRSMDWRIVAWTDADPSKDSETAFAYDPDRRLVRQHGISAARAGDALELLVPLDFFGGRHELWFSLDGGGGSGGHKDVLDNNQAWHALVPAPAETLKPKPKRPWLPEEL